VDSTLHTVRGAFALKRGTLRIDPGSARAEGKLVVDANSGASGSEGRDTKMTRAVLESAKYPEMVFQPDRLEGKLEPEGKIAKKSAGRARDSRQATRSYGDGGCAGDAGRIG
jgi:polyisoprenoid-binding protein YceI